MKKLQGATDLYCVRVGDYRIIYTIVDRVLAVSVVRVARRDQAY